MNELDMQAVLDGLASHHIESFRFAYPGVGKYASCSMEWQYDEFPLLGKKAPRCLTVKLGKALEVRFHGAINPAEVTFKVDRSGPKSLKDVWKKLEVLSVTYGEQ